jgi:tetraacyldisaccharide 4'-kinase
MGNSSSYHVGDEPLVLKMKFPNIGVFVGSNRAFAVPELVGKRPQTNVVLLDDVFQHRSVEVFEKYVIDEYNLPFIRTFTARRCIENCLRVQRGRILS